MSFWLLLGGGVGRAGGVGGADLPGDVSAGSAVPGMSGECWLRTVTGTLQASFRGLTQDIVKAADSVSLISVSCATREGLGNRLLDRHTLVIDIPNLQRVTQVTPKEQVPPGCSPHFSSLVGPI